MIVLRAFLICAGLTLTLSAYLLTRANAQIEPRRTLVTTTSAPAFAPQQLVILRDPFDPLPTPHVRASAAPLGSSSAGSVVTAAPLTSAPPLIVLCQTLATRVNPVAEFYVGTNAVVAGIGTNVAGYQVASIDPDGVNFTTGERLSVAPCSSAGSAAPIVPNPSTPTTPTTSPATILPPEPVPPFPAPRPGTSPSAAAAATAPPATPYQGTSSTTAPTVYGAPAPTIPQDYIPPIIPRH